MTENDIKKAIEHCLDKTSSCIGCPLVNRGDVCGVYLTQYIAEKENEPASNATEDKLNTKIVHTDDSTSKRICQAFESADQAVKGMLEFYNNMSESEQRAFDMGGIYRSMLSTSNELEELKAGHKIIGGIKNG